MHDRVVYFGDSLVVRVFKRVVARFRALYIRPSRRQRRTLVRVPARLQAKLADDPHLVQPSLGGTE